MEQLQRFSKCQAKIFWCYCKYIRFLYFDFLLDSGFFRSLARGIIFYLHRYWRVLRSGRWSFGKNFFKFPASHCAWPSYVYCAHFEPRALRNAILGIRNAHFGMISSSFLVFRSIIEPIRNTKFRHAEDFHTANAISWDMKNQKIRCRSVLKPDSEYDLAYDRLVIGVGMLPNTFGIKGVDEHAFFLKVRIFLEMTLECIWSQILILQEISDARKIRNQLLRNFELSLEPGISDAERQRLLHIAIVGGGPTGVEFGAELYDFVEQVWSLIFRHAFDFWDQFRLLGRHTNL